jgi:histidyl-tRNA synthetase
MSDSVVPFQAPIGTHDVLAPESAQWEGLVATFAEYAYRYGFSLVMTPIFEDVGVFTRGIGEESDVFKKEMYIFTDRGDRRYALRPEGTASVVRAFVQHQPTTPWKAWYITPAFRYERPQKGRYRQHYQLGVEVLGTDDPAVDVTSKGPMLIDHLCDDCRAHFDRVVEGLMSIGIEATLAPRLVRGFDYYNRTTFEFIADAFESAQNSIGGGGRYAQLAEELGGKPTSGIGFGSGVERILLAREAEGVATPLLKRTLDVFVIDTTGDVAAAQLVEELRMAGIATDRAYDQRSMKAQMKAADRSGARFAVLLGPEELAAGEVTIRDLRSQDFDQTQRRVPRSETVATVADLLTKK